MLRNQLSKGNNGLVKTKFITFEIEANSLKEAKSRLERIEIDIINNFKALGVGAIALSAMERLDVLHGKFHSDGKERLSFKWKEISKLGMSTKNLIAPTSFNFGGSRVFKMCFTFCIANFI